MEEIITQIQKIINPWLKFATHAKIVDPTLNGEILIPGYQIGYPFEILIPGYQIGYPFVLVETVGVLDEIDDSIFNLT